MAQVDTSIFSSLLQPPKSLIGAMADINQQDQAQNELQKQRLNLIGTQRDFEDEQNYRKLLAQPGYDPLSSTGVQAAFGVSPKYGMQAQKAYQDSQQSIATVGHLNAQTDQALATAQKTKLSHAIELQSQIAQAAGSATDQASWDRGLQIAQTLGADVSNVPKVFDPATAKSIHDQALTGAQQLDAHFKQLEADERSRHDVAEEGLTKRGQDVTASTSKQNNANNIAKDYTIAGIDPSNPAATSGGGALSPAAIENAAARYNADGTLPPMAMGPRGSVGRTQILNRAAELSMGTDPTQLRVNQMDAKSAGSALTQLTKSKTMSAAFEDTANQNAELALGLSNKLDRTGIPLLNAGLQAWRTGTGSPEATQFAAANETFVNEYAKIMSGGMGNGPVSDAARKKASDLLTTAMTGGDKGQYASNVRLLQQEMRNRMKGFDNQETALRARIGGKGAASATPPASTAGGATVSNW